MRIRYKNTRRLPIVQMFVNNALEYMNIFDLEHTDLNIRFVNKLDGVFAFILYDKKNSKLGS